MDDIEIAQEQEQKDREQALAAHRARRLVMEGARFARDGANGARDCDTCKEPIGEERLRAMPSACRCVECQNRWERYGV